MHTIILGDGRLGLGRRRGRRRARGNDVRILGRPAGDRHDPAAFGGADVVVDASRGRRGASPTSTAALDGRRPAVRHRDDRLGRPTAATSRRVLRRAGAAAVVAANFSLGVGAVRAAGRDRGRAVRRASTASTRTSSSGTAARRPTGHRAPPSTSPAGSSTAPPRAPGTQRPDDLEVVSHPCRRVARDAPRRLRCPRRDRRAAADRPRPLGVRGRRPRCRRLARRRDRATPGLHPFDPVVDELLAAADADAGRRLNHRTTRNGRPTTSPHDPLRSPPRPGASRRVHRARHAVHRRRRARRGRVPPPRPWQVLAGIDGLVPVRHDRRGPDPVGRRARPAHRR